MTGDTLQTREKLPDAVRVLLEAHPRDSWEAKLTQGGLTQFWLQRHLMFRQLMGELKGATQSSLDKRLSPKDFAERLSRYGGFFVQQLHEHHHIEDVHYFPLLTAKEPRLARGFELLDGDHQDLDGQLKAFVDQANGVLQAHRGTDNDAVTTASGRFLTHLSGLERLLDRHLTDEEELIVPILLEYGESELG
ncbi:hemerythrin domain-containing protein [Amorphus orientalis]|uniref:Hemerythrin-like domain-containing protein n=1 Tax=Amorphus orientalis TaxID=649198 RepID=A0AAE4AT97_9HYPH|nr:hemerythrin domain-containing protein [Amorphus orientalis]MDQ0315942.1 hemerythrin-like domain-containing protein [Amorphus orientalis]